MKVFIILPIILSIFLIPFSYSDAFGLSCAPPNTIQSFEDSDVVFSGKVVSKQYLDPSDEHTLIAESLFSIKESFKGISQDQLIISSNEKFWGINFTQGLEYLVFANYSGSELQSPLCGPTNLIEFSNIELVRNISENKILPPLKQISLGITPENIFCKVDYVKIEKFSDNSPACVKLSTAEKLTERGWGVLAPQNNSGNLMNDLNEIDFSNTVYANNQFAFDYYSQINENQNIFFSPWSITSAFAILNEGAKGNTADEIQSVFGFEKDNKDEFYTITSILNQEKDGYTIGVANSLWLAQDFELHAQYADIVQTYYDGSIEKVNFAKDGTDVINSWVSEKTHQKIPKLFDPFLAPNTRLVIANAIYFNGTWTIPFDEENTRDDKFIVSPGEEIVVPFMNKDFFYNFTTADEFQIIELPYGENTASMLIFLPDKIDGISSVESQLTAENLSKWRSEMIESRFFLQIPKFTLETEYSLGKDLIKLGINDAFIGPADFSGISSEPLLIDRAIHKAYVDVSEKGTEAAAATGIAMVTSMPPTFRADHPFVFVILDNETENVLFLGKVVNPSK
jgi:serpin B